MATVLTDDLLSSEQQPSEDLASTIKTKTRQQAKKSRSLRPSRDQAGPSRRSKPAKTKQRERESKPAKTKQEDKKH